MVETPWQSTNLDGVEDNLQGGMCGKLTGRSSQRRRGKTLRWFRSKQHTRSTKSTRAYNACWDIPTAESDARLAWGLPQQHCRGRKNTFAKGGPLAELAASLAISINTVARQQQEIKRMYEQISDIKKRGTQASNIFKTSGGGQTGSVCPYCAAVGRTAPHKNNSCYFNPKNMPDRREWGRKLMNDEGVAYSD